MKKIYALFVVVAAFLSAFTAQAQSIGVSGNVTEVSGEPVSGAIIQVKGNLSSYTTTDTEGFFQFKVPANAVLVVSCLGYITEEIPVNGQGSINVVLETDSQVLDDVIVVAYGTQLKEATTGAVASVKNDTIASAPVTSVDKMLAGKMASSCSPTQASPVPPQPSESEVPPLSTQATNLCGLLTEFLSSPMITVPLQTPV